MATTQFGYPLFDKECRKARPEHAEGVGQQAESPILSARENEVMHWVKMGKTNYEIGAIMEISAFTVKNHLQRIFRKLDALNRTHAVARYERMDKTVGS